MVCLSQSNLLTRIDFFLRFDTLRAEQYLRLLPKAVINDVSQHRTAVINHIPHRALMVG